MASELHDDLTIRAIRWLRGTKRCHLAVAELVTVACVIPDAMGWNSRESHLVEVKVSRADFHRDKRKTAHMAKMLPGKFRWYMTPKGLLTPSDLPEGWGLLEVRPKTIKVVAQSTPSTDEHHETNQVMLYSIIRRISEYGQTLNKKTGRIE